MHLVLLGVLKRLLTIWTGCWGKKHFKHRLSTWEKFQLEQRLRGICLSYPEEFHRITTALKYPKQLKANELRKILLYSGPVISKGILSREKCTHFLYLHLAIRILCSTIRCLKPRLLSIGSRLFAIFCFSIWRNLWQEPPHLQCSFTHSFS